MSAIRKSSVLIAVFIGLFASSARAEGIVTVKVPFAFVVGHKEFPAGQYDIRNVEEIGSVVSIEGMDNRSGTFAFTIPVKGDDPAGNQPALVFIRNENTYTLSEIWESSTEGRELPRLPGPARITRGNEPAETRVYVLAANWK